MCFVHTEVGSAFPPSLAPLLPPSPLLSLVPLLIPCLCCSWYHPYSPQPSPPFSPPSPLSHPPPHHHPSLSPFPTHPHYDSGRVPMVTLAFDALSFPHMIRQATLVQPTLPSSSSSSSSSGSSSSSDSGGDVSGSSSSLDVKVLTKAYVNIKPFCLQPSWPKCALEGIP